MDSTSKLILQKLRDSNKGTEYVCAFNYVWENHADVVIDDFAASLHLPTEDVRAAVRFLKGKGLLEYQIGNGKEVGFHLSHAGLRFDEIKRDETIHFIKTSILTPILVAFLTTVITVNLWPALLSTIQNLLSQIQ